MSTGRLYLPAVSAASENAPMAITMQNYSLIWTDPDGTARMSVVSYDKPSAEARKSELEAAGCTAVEVVAARPGERVTAKG
jgi:hypothetical protein